MTDGNGFPVMKGQGRGRRGSGAVCLTGVNQGRVVTAGCSWTSWCLWCCFGREVIGDLTVERGGYDNLVVRLAPSNDR